jgi:hypothetical protein
VELETNMLAHAANSGITWKMYTSTVYDEDTG